MAMCDRPLGGDPLSYEVCRLSNGSSDRAEEVSARSGSPLITLTTVRFRVAETGCGDREKGSPLMTLATVQFRIVETRYRGKGKGTNKTKK